MKSVYVETTIPSLATGRPSRDIIVKIQKYNEKQGLFTPLLLTPDVLMEFDTT